MYLWVARRSLRLLIVALIVCGLAPASGLGAPVAAAGARNVSPTGADSGDCTGAPCRTIAYALGQSLAGDTIILAAGTYTEHSLSVGISVTIAGASAASTIIDAMNAGPGVFIYNGVSAQIHDLTLRNAGQGLDRAGQFYDDGISIEAGGTLALANAVIAAGHFQGILNYGTLNVTNSLITNQPGIGLQNLKATAVATFTDSTVSYNGLTSSGIDHVGSENFFGANLTVTRSTFIGNAGPAIDNDGSSLTVINSTLTGNAVGILHNGTGTLTNVTIAGNSVHGISSRTTQPGFLLKNTLVADSCDGPVPSGDYNIDGGSSCDFIQPHDQSNITNPHLGALTNNGGATLTMALLPGSPAINAGNSDPAVCPAADQRGTARPQGGLCDIGAYEFTAGFVLTPPATAQGAGNPFSLSVTDVDASGAIVIGYTGTVHFTSADPQAALPSDYKFTGADAGTHTFSGVILKTAGTERITATDTAIGTLTGNTFVTVLAGPAAALAVAPASLQPVAGVPTVVTVTAQDAYHNANAGYLGTVHFTSTDSQAVLPGLYGYTAADAGVHAFSITFNNLSGRTLTASDGTLSGMANVTVSAAPATVYVNVAWAGSPAGTDPDGAGPATQFGYDAFAAIGDALPIVATGGTINVAAGTYREHDLTLARNVTITGVGPAGTTVDANQAGRGFIVNTGVTATLSGLTIRGASAGSVSPLNGAGIWNNGGALTLATSVVTNNAAPYGNGGGIENDGSLALTNTTMSGNTARNGAGIMHTGTALAITGSTISGNTLVDDSPGPVPAGSGIMTLQGTTTTLVNSTVSGNSGSAATSGGIADSGALSLMNVTLAGNTPIGIFYMNTQNPPLAFTDTLFTDGCSLPTPNRSGDYNLDTGNGQCAGNGIHNLIGVDARISPLADNGGATPTHALMPGSPAIDAGGPSCPATDQRGIARPQPAGGACDIGAYEYVPVTPAIGAVAPAASGPGGRAGIVISGTGFQTGSGVSFGLMNAPVTAVSADGTALTVIAPPAGPGVVNVTVTNPGGRTATKTNAFTYNPPPVIASLSPTAGLAGSPTLVTIAGSAFQAGATVQFGGVAATNVTVVSSTTITVFAPAQPAGSVNVMVTNPDGGTVTVPNGFTYAAAAPAPAARSGPVTDQPPPNPSPRAQPAGSDPVAPVPPHR